VSSAAILIIDDEERFARNMANYLEREGHAVRVAASAEKGLSEVAEFRPDLILLDIRLPGMDGLEALRRLRESDPDVRVVMVTAHGNVQNAVDALKAGAYDYLTKPLILRDLKRLVDKFASEERLAGTLSYYQHRDARGSGLDRIVGASPPILRLKGEIQRLAQSERQMAADAAPPPVLVIGETGTGKELVARAVHFESPRAAAPFIEINCAAIPAHLIEDELFGHERGAFTDAREMKRGLFEVADRGTLFLDEIGDLAPELQPKLLKVLETRSFRRLGGTREMQVDVRLVAATNRDLQAEVRAGRFREDLYYRLSVFPLLVPPLRERSREDVLELAHRFLREIGRRHPSSPTELSGKALEVLAGYAWPGNVRELRNVLERALVLASGSDRIEPEHLPPTLKGPGAPRAAREEPSILPLEEVERRHIERTLFLLGGNRTSAAEKLGISRSTLHTKIQQYGLESVGRG
jgi:two-component system response regulator AtoC